MTEGVEITGVAEYPPERSIKLNGPPGTGKTTQLLERLTSLLNDGVDVEDVTFVTYRTQMAHEFLHRLYARGHISQDEVFDPTDSESRTTNFGTIHAVCNRQTSYAEVVTDSDRADFIETEYNAEYEASAGPWDDEGVNETGVGELLFDAYQWCVENDTHSFPKSPNYMELSDRVISPPSFADFDEAWRQYKAAGNEDGDPLQDFTGMLREVDVRGLSPSGEVLIVDEYHDMTPIMAGIVEMWMENFETVIVGGDPLQAIYTYKGADPSFFTDLDLPEVLLDRTYRVPSRVWEYAKEVIKHDPPDITPDAGGGEVRPVRADPHRVCEVYGEESTMLLARTQSQLHDLRQSLDAHGYIYRSQDEIGGWNNSRKLMALFNSLQKLEGVRPMDHVNPHTGQAGLAHYDEEAGESAKHPGSVTLDGYEATALIDMTYADHLAGTKTEIRSWASAKPEVDGGELADRVEPSFWTAMTRGPESVEKLLAYGPKDKLKAAMERYDEPLGNIETAPVPDLLTIHASKGREADTVALYDGVPAAVQRNLRDGERQKEAESRVWYVGCTRAAKELLVVRDHFDYVDPYLPGTNF